MNIGGATDATVGLPLWLEGLIAVMTVLGGGALLRLGLNSYLKRRGVVQERTDARADARTVETREIAEIGARSSETMLDRLTEQVSARLADYKAQIEQMRAEHTAEITQLRQENRQLERRVDDLRRTLQDYQMGLQVPRGMVLIPLTDVRQMRSESPGVLPRPWYTGEDEMPPAGSMDARITPLPNGPGGPKS